MSIFPTPSLDPAVSFWADRLDALTPVEQHAGTYVKREDAFAPLGPGGINGSKLRGLILMMRNRRDSTCVVTGASVKSPQHSMTAAVARQFDQSTVHVIGGTRPDTAWNRPQVRMAARFGAEFNIIPVGYNTALQSRVRSLALQLKGAVLPYGISPEPEEVLDFHRLGGLQTANLPDVDTLVVPAGSCNTLASVLYGLQRERPATLKRVVTVGIGPDRLRWTWDRLAALGVQDGYRYNLPSCLKRAPIARNYLELVHVDPHGEGFSTYEMEMRENLGPIALHPTYEGKVKRYLDTHYPDLLGDRACLWIVGGPATLAAMEPHLDPFLGADTMTELPLWKH